MRRARGERGRGGSRRLGTRHIPRGSTALSAGLILASGTRFQRALQLSDSPDLFSRDSQAKAHGEADEALVRLVAREAGPTVEWLADRHGLPFSVVDDFDYPGHSARRMHGLPSRSGVELVDRLRAAVEQTPAMLLTQATVASLFVNDARRVLGVEIVSPDGAREAIGCNALVPACNGYGGNPDLVARHIPAMKDALYFGHPGNRGDAVIWGRELLLAPTIAKCAAAGAPRANRVNVGLSLQRLTAPRRPRTKLSLSTSEPRRFCAQAVERKAALA